MDQVEVDRQAVQSGKARLAVAENRLRAPVRHPSAPGPRHAALGNDARVPLRPIAAKSAGEQPFVLTEWDLAPTVRARGVEHGYTRPGGGRDRRDRTLLVVNLVGRQAHASESDAQLRRV
jgi:hypothetical protein